MLPLDMEAVGETVYMNILSRAKRYVYITTPYLIVDNEMVTALSHAAKQGVDVRIITPHIGGQVVCPCLHPGLLRDAGGKRGQDL